MPDKYQPQLNPGDKVKIYRDPVTEKDLEGIAELLSYLDHFDEISTDEGLEYWQVQFQGGQGEPEVQRFIKVEIEGGT